MASNKVIVENLVHMAVRKLKKFTSISPKSDQSEPSKHSTVAIVDGDQIFRNVFLCIYYRLFKVQLQLLSTKLLLLMNTITMVVLTIGALPIVQIGSQGWVQLTSTDLIYRLPLAC